MNRLVCLTLLMLLGFAAHAQVELSTDAGVSLHSNDGDDNKITPAIRSNLDLDKAWTLKKHLSINTGLNLESLFAQRQVSLSFDSKISLNYDLTNKECTENSEKYILGLSISPSMLSNPMFFKKPFYSTTLGINAEAKIGILDIKITAAPLELLNINDQYASPLCMDLDTQICLDLDGNVRDNAPMFDNTDASTVNHQLKINCNVFQRSVPVEPYTKNDVNKIYEKAKLTYIDANIAYQYKIERKPIKIDVCFGLQTSAGDKGAPTASINYYCTTGFIFVIPVKN